MTTRPLVKKIMSKSFGIAVVPGPKAVPIPVHVTARQIFFFTLLLRLGPSKRERVGLVEYHEESPFLRKGEA